MSRERFTFRPSAQLDGHRKAWAYLQAVPDGQRSDFLVRAILRMREDTVLEETLRRGRQKGVKSMETKGVTCKIRWSCTTESARKFGPAAAR